MAQPFLWDTTIFHRPSDERNSFISICAPLCGEWRINMTIGERIKVLRKKNDLTQEKLADYLCVSCQAVSKWECGLACPDLSLIPPLTRLFNLTSDDLLGLN